MMSIGLIEFEATRGAARPKLSSCENPDVMDNDKLTQRPSLLKILRRIRTCNLVIIRLSQVEQSPNSFSAAEVPTQWETGE